MLKRSALLFMVFCFSTLFAGCSPAAATNELLKDGDVIKHSFVHQEAGHFCGWPANNGVWNWGDEIVVGFHLMYYKESIDGHSIDRDKPTTRLLARSLDGGQTWTIEKPAIFNPQPGTRIESVDCPGGIDFAAPGFAMTLRGGRFYISYDRCRNWQGPYRLPDFGQIDIMARTDYIVNSRDDCHLFLTATKRDGNEGRVFCARTQDGGKTIRFLSWIGPEPITYDIMPSTVRLSANELVASIRHYDRGDIRWGRIDIYRSIDNGQSWEYVGPAAETGDHSGNPPSMLRLRDGRLCLTYCFRAKPHGVRAKLSSDGGRTWGDVIHLRDDGRTWDIGYMRTVERADGKLVSMYYYTTENDPEQHIASTIWDPSKFD
jgi:hypothetical protein